MCIRDSIWSVSIDGLPRYDAQGYEIFYYATEHSNIDWSLIDYAEVQYYMGTEDVYKRQRSLWTAARTSSRTRRP